MNKRQICKISRNQQLELKKQQKEFEVQRQLELQIQKQESARREELNRLQDEQIKLDKENALINEYNSKMDAFDKEIIDIKNKYYTDVENIKNQPVSMGFITGRINALTDDVNWEIQKIQTQQESLRLEYNSKINAL